MSADNIKDCRDSGIGSKRQWRVSFALSILLSKFKSAEEPEDAEMAFVLLQKREEEEKEEEVNLLLR